MMNRRNFLQALCLAVALPVVGVKLPKKEVVMKGEVRSAYAAIHSIKRIDDGSEHFLFRAKEDIPPNHIVYSTRKKRQASLFGRKEDILGVSSSNAKAGETVWVIMNGPAQVRSYFGKKKFAHVAGWRKDVVLYE